MFVFSFPFAWLICAFHFTSGFRRRSYLFLLYTQIKTPKVKICEYLNNYIKRLLSCIKKDVVTPEKEVVVSSEVVEVRPVSVADSFKPIRQTYSSDPTYYYYGNYDDKEPLSLRSILSLLLGGM